MNALIPRQRYNSTTITTFDKLSKPQERKVWITHSHTGFHTKSSSSHNKYKPLPGPAHQDLSDLVRSITEPTGLTCRAALPPPHRPADLWWQRILCGSPPTHWNTEITMPHLWTLTSRCIIPSECFYPRLVSFFFFTLLTFRYTFDDCGWKAPQFQLTKLYILLYIVFSGHSITSTDVGSFHIVKDHQTKQTRERCDITTDGSLVRAVGTVHFAVADLIRSQAHGCVVCTRVLGRLADGGLAGLFVRAVLTVDVPVAHPALCDALACRDTWRLI